MFSRNFANDAKYPILTHRAFYFIPEKGVTNEEIIEGIQTEGIAEYFQPTTWDKEYGDHRFKKLKVFSRSFKIASYASCCAFTKMGGYFYMFPIHRAELDNVGLTEQDLLLWIKKFNDQKVGFNYLYFGEQPGPKITLEGEHGDWFSKHGPVANSNMFYWVGVPAFPENVSALKPYLHWVVLRYLWDAKTSGASKDKFGHPGVERLAYYNIPRVTMMLHEEHKIPFLKAFLYAHIAHPWCCGNSLVYSDYMGLKGEAGGMPYNYELNGYQAPCVNIKRAHFKVLWDNHISSLNNMLTKSGHEITKSNTTAARRLAEFTDIPELNAPYDPKMLHTMFNQGKYAEFIKAIKDSYRTKKVVKENEKVSA